MSNAAERISFVTNFDFPSYRIFPEFKTISLSQYLMERFISCIESTIAAFNSCFAMDNNSKILFDILYPLPMSVHQI